MMGEKKPEERENFLPQTVEDLKGKTPDELRKIVDVLDAHLKSLHQDDVTGELRDMTEEETQAFDLGMELRDWAVKRIDEHVRIAEVFRRRPQSVERVYNNIRHGLDDSNAADIRRLTRREAQERALRILDSRDKSQPLDTDQMDHVDRQIRRNNDIALRIIATENDAYREAWQKLVTGHEGWTLSEEERDAIRTFQEYRAMTEGTGSAGGYGIPVFIDPSIILTAQGSANPFLQLCRQVAVNTNAWKGVSSAGVTWAFQAEGAAVTDNSPTLAQPSVTVNMARGFLPYTIELDQDYPGFAEEMSTLLAAGYDELLVQKFTVGSGTNEPNGLVTALAADTTVQTLLAVNGALATGDVYGGWQNLPQRFRRNASWLMSVNINNKIRQLGTANVFHAFTVNLPAEWADTLFGRTVYESPYMTDMTTSTVHTNVAIVGDFQNYLIATRGGMSVELVPLLVDVTNNRPTGQRGWFAYSRIGGNSVNNKGFQLICST